MVMESIFRGAFWILFTGVFVMRVYFAHLVRRAGERVMPDRQAVEREGRGLFAARVASFLLLLAWLTLYAINPSWMQVVSVPLPTWVRWLGMALGLASLGFWAWTQTALGKEWSPQLQLREEHHLVTTGPYARIRHPLYTAMVAFGASLAIVAANWVFLALAIVAITGLLLRVPKEEEMMLQEFGEEYRDYMRRTGKFLPRLR